MSPCCGTSGGAGRPDTAGALTAGVAAAATSPPSAAGPPPLPRIKKKCGRKPATSVPCQVPGCAEDLAGTVGKNFFKRYRICREHCVAPSLRVFGSLQRFCQQCGRFHPLDQFEEDRRSCIEALARHRTKRQARGRAGGGQRKDRRQRRRTAAGASKASADSDSEGDDDEEEEEDQEEGEEGESDEAADAEGADAVETGAVPEERPALLSGGHGAPAAAAGLAQQRQQPQQGSSSPRAATAPGVAGASPPMAGMQRLDSGSSGTTAAAWQPEPASPGSRFRSGSGTLTAALLQTLQRQPSSSPPCAGALSLQLETTGSNILIELDCRLVLAGELPTPSAVAGSHPAQQRQPQLLPQQPAEWQPAAEAGPPVAAQRFSPAAMRFVPVGEPLAGQPAKVHAQEQARQQWPLQPVPPILPAGVAWPGACLVAGQSSGGSSSGSLFAEAMPELPLAAPLLQPCAQEPSVEASLEGWISDVFLEGRPEALDFDALLAAGHW